MNAKRAGSILLIAFLVLASVSLASAAPPVVKTVPWAANNPLVPHDTYPTRAVILKGTVTNLTAGHSYNFWWDFGDGSPLTTPAAVTNTYALETSHVYAGATGTVWTARLTVQDTGTGESHSKEYYVAMREKNLPVEVNIAIDNGLWYLHKNLYRYNGTAGAQGDWTNGGSSYANLGYQAVTALNLNAFEVNGHLESGSTDNPYTETVQRAMRGALTMLYCPAIGTSQTNPSGTFNPDGNGNALGCRTTQSNEFYQTGPFIDALVASGTPLAIAATGPTNIVGRTYRDIVQDLADYYAYCQYDVGVAAGGWRYSCNQGPDNSAAQWGAIGLIPAEREWGILVAPQVGAADRDYWLIYSQATNGAFGYDSPSYFPWGAYGVTPSGMVQLAWVGIGRGNSRWDKAETFMRDRFANTGGATNAVKDYYYGLFAFVKAMLLHATTDGSGNIVPSALSLLQSQTTGVPAIDWYAAEAAKGAPTDGVARTLVGDQAAAGYWFGHSVDGNQQYLETAMAIMMLNRTIFTAGAPVAVISANPNPAVVGAIITLDGGGSFHQDAARNIVAWNWDLDNDGAFDDATGPLVTTSFGALGSYPVHLRVTDDSVPPKTADTTVTILVNQPPVAPTADAGGPYNFCPEAKPWFLDGRASTNPDEGQSEVGKPGDTIQSYLWTLGSDTIGTTAIQDATTYFEGKGVGSYLVTLRVTDTTATSFPSAGTGDLSDTDTAEVFVRSATDPVCAQCPRNLKAYPKITKVELSWTFRAGALKYNVYRGTTSGGPYLKIGEASIGLYVDTKSLVNNPPTTYYYVIREVAANGAELCQSNQATALLRRR
jgi:hypothetical protein